MKKSSRTKTKGNARTKKAPTVKRRMPRRAASVGGGDKPNQAWLTIRVDSVDAGGDSSGAGVEFTASFGIESVGFGVDTGQEHRRILYDGPYILGPYEIDVSAEEPNSDDEYTDEVITLTINPNTLEGTGSATITQKPGDKDDNDSGDEPNDPDDPDETASFTVTVSAEVKAAVEITNIDVTKNQIQFDLLPEILGEGNLLVVVVSSKKVDADEKQPDVNLSQQMAGGRGKTIALDWNTFPQDPTKPFHAQSVTIFWNNLAVVAREDTRELTFTTYGVFRITRYFTPDDDQWNGPTETAAFGSTQRTIHTTWISKVRCEEGKGRSQGQIVKIRGPGKRNASKTIWIHKPGTQRLSSDQEGGFGIQYLTVDKSLAKNQSDPRFHGHDQILLLSDPGKVFEIEDVGNWTQKDEPAGRRPIDHFDRYFGVGGPGARRGDVGMSFVIKLK